MNVTVPTHSPLPQTVTAIGTFYQERPAPGRTGVPGPALLVEGELVGSPPLVDPASSSIRLVGPAVEGVAKLIPPMATFTDKDVVTARVRVTGRLLDADPTTLVVDDAVLAPIAPTPDYGTHSAF